jgi:uncharacterized membrane protein YbaN (DUF454 family)
LSKAVVKYFLIFAGLFFIALGVVGIVVPGLPTTVFLLIAAACFAKSSPCMHAWLLSHRWFGPIILNWQQSRTIPKKAKVIALCSITMAAIYSTLAINNHWLVITILFLMVFPAVFLYRLPLTEDKVEANE